MARSSSKTAAFFVALLAAALVGNVSSFSTFFHKHHRRLSIEQSPLQNTSRQRRSSTAPSSRLFVSAPSKTAQSNIIFQKVVRPPLSAPEIYFLGYLVEYLEKRFELPARLPMLYESISAEEADRCTLIWDSPLSPSSEHTRMKVEVVGIYTDADDDNNNASPPSIPKMAMVVVSKHPNSKEGTTIPAMMVNLFQDSEQKILKSLDRGLEDFISGKIKFADKQPEKKLPNYKTAEEVVQAEMVDGLPQRGSFDNDIVLDTTHTESFSMDAAPQPQTFTKDVQEPTPASMVIDAVQLSEEEEEDARIVAEAKRAIDARNNKNVASSSSTSTDFAVEAAKKAALKRGGGDFAVAAAKKLAKKKTKPKEEPVVVQDKTEPEEEPPVDLSKKAFQSWKAPNKTPRAFRTTISRPMEYAQKGRSAVRGSTVAKVQPSAVIEKGSSMKKTKTKVIPKKPVAKVEPATVEEKELPVTEAAAEVVPKKSVAKVEPQAEEEKDLPVTEAVTEVMPKKPVARVGPPPVKEKVSSATVAEVVPQYDEPIKKRNINVVYDSDDVNRADKSPFLADANFAEKATSAKNSNKSTEMPSNKSAKMPSKQQIEQDIIAAAQDVMTELAEQGKDLTAEELLEDILKFDAEQVKENQPGTGFAGGAFEKAKELLQEQNAKRQAKIQQQQAAQDDANEVAGVRPDIAKESSRDDSSGFKEMTPDEELKAMFEAGQNIAEGRITQVYDKETGRLSGGMGTTDADIDELIAAEKDVSSYARVLDDDLAELEVRINRSPDEEYDGPPKNPVFDVMSGPEKYNPNVDPETVNYPGAMPGTKNLRLPKELDEAIKQAGFAAEVLQSLKTVENVDSKGEKTFQYFMGEEEMTVEQVENLQNVVNDAVGIGLINDPLNYLSEQSRLQLLLDEMWNQPEERFRDIASGFKDLLLSENFVNLIQERLTAMADRDLEALRQDDESLEEPHKRERELLGHLVVYAQLLLKEAKALGAELEAQQLEIVRSICKVAMDPNHKTEEETAMALSDVVRDMRPLLDNVFIAYLKYAVAEEKARLARAGLLDDPEHNQWLFVLQIVQQGVYTEVSRSINRYIDHLSYILRMKTPQQRRQLLKKIIDTLPTLDVRPFVQVVDNIVASLGDGARGDFEGITELGEMTNKLLQLRRDVDEMLPPERIALMSKDADEWAARQKKKLMDSRKISQQRLEAVRDTEHLQGEIEEMGRRGEVERFD